MPFFAEASSRLPVSRRTSSNRDIHFRYLRFERSPRPESAGSSGVAVVQHVDWIHKTRWMDVRLEQDLFLLKTTDMLNGCNTIARILIRFDLNFTA